jgi:rare lipoprotein A
MNAHWLSVLFVAFWVAASVWVLTPPVQAGRVAWTSGRASWYGEGYRGKTMANGKPFDPEGMTCASWHHPFGTLLRVTNARNGLQVVVEVTDRGPAQWTGCILDLSSRAFRRIADPRVGKIDVRVEVLGVAK